jgi:O-antigen ligase
VSAPDPLDALLALGVGALVLVTCRRSLALGFTLLIAALIAASSSVATVKEPFLTARWGALVGIVLAVAWPLPTSVLKWPMAAACALASTVALISAAWSIDRSLTLARAASFALLLWVVVAAARSRSVRGGNPSAFVIGLGALSGGVLLSSLSLWLINPGIAVYVGDLRGILENPNALGLFLGLTFPFALASAELLAPHWLWFPSLGVVYAVVIAFANARTGMLALLVGILTYGVARHAWRPLFIIAPLVLATAVTAVVIDPAISRAHPGQTEVGRILGARDEAWSATAELVRHRPVLGYGFGTADRVFSRKPTAAQFLYFQGGNPANAYLQLALETGILGVTFLLPLGLAVATTVAGRRERLARPAQAAFIAVVIAGLCASLFESLLTTAGAPWAPLIWLSATSVVAGASLAGTVEARSRRPPTWIQRLKPRKTPRLLPERQADIMRSGSESDVGRVPLTSPSVRPRHSQRSGHESVKPVHDRGDAGRWIFYSVGITVLILGAIATFAIYTWGWHRSSMHEQTLAARDEQARANAVGERVRRVKCASKPCVVTNLRRVAPSLWRISLSGGVQGCFLIDLDRFVFRNTQPLSGVARIPCTSLPLYREQELTVAIDSARRSLPYVPQAQVNGLRRDVVNEVARRLQVSTVRWIKAPVRGFLSKARPIDLAAYDSADLALLRTGFRQSLPYLTIREALVVRERHSSPIAESQLNRLQFGAADAQSLSYIRSVLHPRRAPKGYVAPAPALRALNANAIDGLVIADPAALALVASKPRRLEIAARLGVQDRYVLVTRPRNPLAESIDATLRKMNRDGTLRRLQERWFPGINGTRVLRGMERSR